MNSLLKVTYLFVLEFFVFLIFIFFYYITQNSLPPLTTLVVFAVGGISLFTLLVKKFKDKGIWLYFILITPLVWLISQQFHLSLFMLIVLVLFVCWRGIVLLTDPSRQSEIALLLISLIVGFVLIIYAATSHYSYLTYIIALLILQMLFIVVGGFVQKWYAIGDDREKFAIYFSRILMMIGLVGIILSFSLSYFRIVLFSILKAVTYLFTILTVPLEKLILFLMNRYGGEEFVPKPAESDVKPNPDDLQPREHAATFDYVFYFLIGICVLLLIIYLYRKWKGTIVSRVDSNLVFGEETGQSPLVKGSGFFRGRLKPPEDPVRREIFQLQKFAKKLKLSRLPHESLEEWWRRIGVSEPAKTIGIYKKVRYGEVTVTSEEQLQVKEDIRELKRQLTQIRKKNV